MSINTNQNNSNPYHYAYDKGFIYDSKNFKIGRQITIKKKTFDTYFIKIKNTKSHAYYPGLYVNKLHNIRFFYPYSSQVLINDDLHDVSDSIAVMNNNKKIYCHSIKTTKQYEAGLPILDKETKLMCGIVHLGIRKIIDGKKIYYYAIQGSSRFIHANIPSIYDILITAPKNTKNYIYEHDYCTTHKKYLKPVGVFSSYICANENFYI